MGATPKSIATTDEREARRGRIALAGLAFALTAPTTYFLERGYEVLRVGRIDPSLILQSSNVDYFWRLIIASWWGGATALGVYLLPGGTLHEGLRRKLSIGALLLGALWIAVAVAVP